MRDTERNPPVVGRRERPLEAAERHVKHARVEAAQTDVAPQLRVVHALLQEAAVVAERHLGLVRVEVVRGGAGQALHVAGVQIKDAPGDRPGVGMVRWGRWMDGWMEG